MTLCVAQLSLLSCCRTLIIVCGFYAAVKCFCAAPIPKKKTRHWRVSRAALYFIFVFILSDPLLDREALRQLFYPKLADHQNLHIHCIRKLGGLQLEH